MKFKRVTITLVSASIVAVAGLVALPGAAFASSRTPHPSHTHSTTLYVATSGTDTDNSCTASINPCRTIDFALTQAASGATIKVQAGTYNEQVQITKPVTIMGAGASQTVIEPTSVPSTDTDTDSTEPQAYIVDVTHTTGVNLKDIGVNGSAASSSIGACAPDYVGVYYHDASGSMTNDAVTGIELTPAADFFGCQSGLGVYAATDSGSVTPTVLSMSSDNVNSYQKNGITCDDPGTVCNIKNTTVTGAGSNPTIAQNGIQIWAASAGVTANVITGNSYEGGPGSNATGMLLLNPYTLSVKNNQVTHNDTDIWLLQDSPGYVICGNLSSSCTNPAAAGTTFAITGNHASDAINYENNPIGSEYGDGIDVDSVTAHMTISGNVVENDPGNGIALFGTTGVLAQRNTVRSDDNGFYLGAGTVGVSANANTLRKNTVSASSNVGILLDIQTGGNIVVHNSSQLNSVLDAQDNSSGAGTAGTGNNWEADNCTTSAPSGLCHTAASVKKGTAADTRGQGGGARAATRRGHHSSSSRGDKSKKTSSTTESATGKQRH
jgi:hypothetical protein